MNPHSLTRRDALRLLGLSTAGAVLYSASPATAPGR